MNNKQAVIQENWMSEQDPTSICSFDYEAIEAPTYPLLHQAARFWYFKRGRGKIVIDSVEYDIVPGTLVSITPWQISNVTEVAETLQMMKVIYDFQFFNYSLKGIPADEQESADVFRLLTAQPVLKLDSVQIDTVESILDDMKRELGVASTLVKPTGQPLSSLYVINKLFELMILYDRYVLAENGEYLSAHKDQTNNIMSYIYAHSAERLTLAKVAQVFFISESSLAKQIADLSGTTFVKLLNDIRIDKASDFLIYTNMTLDEIAELMGFTDAPHLCKHFTQKVGVTPNRYRKIYTKSQVSSYDRSAKNIAYGVVDYIYQNYADESLNQTETAARFGLSSAELNRLLLYYAEKNFDTLVSYVRVNKACELLIKTSDPVIDIATAVGYSNIKTFSLHFYKFKGMNPSEFRKSVTLQKGNGEEEDYGDHDDK